MRDHILVKHPEAKIPHDRWSERDDGYMSEADHDIQRRYGI